MNPDYTLEGNQWLVFFLITSSLHGSIDPGQDTIDTLIHVLRGLVAILVQSNSFSFTLLF